MAQRKPTNPPRWTEQELETQRQRALDNFIRWRGKESVKVYTSTLERNADILRRLFELSNNLRSFDSNLLQKEPSLVDAARYLVGPPISADDLATLIGAKPSRSRLAANVARRIVTVIRTAWDPVRFPWIRDSRKPSLHEKDAAILWTAGVWAVEQLRTLWRTESSRRQEEVVVKALVDSGFEQQKRIREVTALDQIERGYFMREVELAGAKCDVPVRLRDGRVFAIECKVSNSSLNSVKRLIRETGGKARHWRSAFGQQVLTGAVLAGVYKLVNLKDAQDNYEISIFWEHDLQPLRSFVSKTRT